MTPDFLSTATWDSVYASDVKVSYENGGTVNSAKAHGDARCFRYQ